MSEKTVAKIKIIGIGNGGNSAVNQMIEEGIGGVEFVAVDTDNQTLKKSKAGCKIQIATNLTKKNLSSDDLKLKVLEESKDDILSAISNVDMLFIVAGMGGCTATAIAPFIASVAKELDILTIGVVTKPFTSEGKVRIDNAMEGIKNLKNSLNTLFVISNDRVLEMNSIDVSNFEEFSLIDSALKQNIKSITDLITAPNLISLDFFDIYSVMKNGGYAYMGFGVGTKEDGGYVSVAENALNSLLLETSVEDAKNIFVNISGVISITDFNNIIEFISKKLGTEEMIIGTTLGLKDKIEVSIFITGFSEINDNIL